MSDTIKRIGTDNDFLGHIGGDDFIMVMMRPARARTIARTDRRGVRPRTCRTLYDPTTRKNGYIAAKDRSRSNNVRFPLMSLSLAIVTQSAAHHELQKHRRSRGSN